MSFVRIPRRSQSTSSLNSSRVKNKRKPKPAWDDSVSDLSQHKATRDEIERRRLVHQSKNLDTVKHEKIQKQIAKAKAQEERLKNTSSYNSTRLLREILYDQSQLEDALSHSDRVMAVVQDLFGDDPKRKTGFPNVTLAPGQKASYRPQGPLMTAQETPSRLTILSESVMDAQALNDMRDEEHSESDSDAEKENVPVSFQGNMNIDRFQDFIRKQQAKQASHPYDSTHASLLQDTGNKKLGKERKHAHSVSELGSTSLNSTHEGEGDMPPAAMTTAINDTAKVKKKSRSRIEKEKQQKEGEDRQAGALNLSTVLRGLEQEMTDYEVATGRQPNSGTQDNTSVLSSNTPGVSGYTTLLVQTIAKLIGYLKETEARWLEERHIREQMQYQIAEQRILLDAITADLLATQDLQLQNQQEFNQSITHTQMQINTIQEMLSGLGLQKAAEAKPIHPSEQRRIPQEHMTQQSIESQNRESDQQVSSHQGQGGFAPKVDEQPSHHKYQAECSDIRLPLHLGQAAPVHQVAEQSSHHQHQLGQTGLHQTIQRGPQQPGQMLQTYQDPSQSQPQVAGPSSHQQHQLGHSSLHQTGSEQPQQPCTMSQSYHPSQQSTLYSQSTDFPANHAISSQSGQSQPVSHSSRLTTVQSELNQLPAGSSTKQSRLQGQPVNSHHLMQHQRAVNLLEGTTASRPTGRQDSEIPPALRSPHNLADEFFNALQQATSRTETASQPGTQNTIPAAQTHPISHLTNASKFPHEMRNSNLVQNNVPKFTSSFLEDKRHLGTRDTLVPFQPAILLSPPRQRDRSTVVRPKVTSVSAHPMSTQDGMAVGTIHSIQRGAHVNSTAPDLDIASRIAQLTKQHEEAQTRLSQLESNGCADSRMVGSGQGFGTSQLATAVSNQFNSNRSNSAAHPVSPPISPIPYEHPPIKQVKRGASHLAKEGRTIHVSLPRPDDLEISATSTPSPKTAENRTKARLSSSSQGSLQWKTPERRHVDGSLEEQFFALTAHMST